MNKTRFLSLAVVALLMLNLVSGAALILRKKGGKHHHGHDHPHKKRGQHGHVAPEDAPRNLVIAKLDLNDEQIEAYMALIEVHKKSIKSYEAEMRENKDALFRNLKGEDETVVESQMEKIASIQVNIERTHYHHFRDLKRICREDQIPAFNELTEDLGGIFARKHHPPKRR